MEAQDSVPNEQFSTTDHGPTNVPNPLRGVVLCCTSIEPDKRAELASHVEQMGAQHKLDLTSEVTHLIVGAYDTPKYRYVAKERPDVKVLTAGWVEGVRQLWMADTGIDLDALEKEHTLPTFSTLKICLTGFDDPIERTGISNLIQSNGAEYHGDLTKAVTHLVANKPEGSKYKHAKIWGLQVVSIEWLHDSIDRGMILEERLYSPEMPVEQRGKDAWIRRKIVRSPLGKRRHDASVSVDEGKRKLRRTASTKLTSQNEKLWGDMLGGGVVVQAAASGVWEKADDLSKDKNAREVIAVRQDAIPTEPAEETTRSITTNERGTFSECRFYIFGFNGKKLDLLRMHLKSHDGEISNTPEDFVGPCDKMLFLLVPHSVPESKLPDLPECDSHIQTVTEWWVERCVNVKMYVDPSEYTFGRPFPKFPIPQFSDLSICSTGFDGTLLLHLSKAVALVGAKYDESFSKNASVLVCNPNRATRQEKLNLAQEWKIPLVSLDWLLDSIESGTRQKYQKYLYRAKKPKGDVGLAPMVDEDLVGLKQQESLAKKANSSSSFLQLRGSGEANKQPRASKPDQTAFQDESTILVKPEPSSDPAVSTSTSEPSTELHIEPLTEMSLNSPRKQSQAPPSPTKPQASGSVIPQEALTTAITSLLAKSKAATTSSDTSSADQAPAQDPSRKKRAPSRILGRATSIASTNGGLSRASSVDSTASTGAAVIWPLKTEQTLSGDQRCSVQPQASSLTAAKPGNDNDSQPPQTQMRYDDVESSEYKARVMAKMTGEKLVRKEIGRTATVASLGGGIKDNPRTRKSRLRERGGPGFR